MFLSKKCLIMSFCAVLGACNWSQMSVKEILTDPFGNGKSVSNEQVKLSDSIVVCRSKQCAPAKLSMSKEYIYNSLLQLFDNNDNQKVLVCQSTAASKTCLETYITVPLTVGIAPAYLYIDYAKISNVSVNKQNNKINLLIDYNVTVNGQYPGCSPAQSIIFAKDVNHVLLEDSGYNCKMTTVGSSTVKTIFAVDYIDLDYGFIGGHYSIGISGPAYGGGAGYMILKMPKNAYPLSPALMKKTTKSAVSARAAAGVDFAVPNKKPENAGKNTVEIFPISK